MRFWIAILLFLPSWTLAREVDSIEGGITIYRELRMEGRLTGYSYWAENGGDVPIWLSIDLRDAVNVYNGLATGRLYIFPHQVLFLGTVTQKEAAKPYQWRYVWEADPVRNQAGVGGPSRRELREKGQQQLREDLNSDSKGPKPSLTN